MESAPAPTTVFSGSHFDGLVDGPLPSIVHRSTGSQDQLVVEPDKLLLWHGHQLLEQCDVDINCSPTMYCAALINREGLSTANALAGVHEHHPWSRPDSGHRLQLRWLEEAHDHRD